MSFLELADRWEEGRRVERERRAAEEASYRAALRTAFTLAAQGDVADQVESDHVLELLAVLVDNLGVRVADAIRCEERSRWLTITGRCPACGGSH